MLQLLGTSRLDGGAPGHLAVSWWRSRSLPWPHREVQDHLALANRFRAGALRSSACHPPAHPFNKEVGTKKASSEPCEALTPSPITWEGHSPLKIMAIRSHACIGTGKSACALMLFDALWDRGRVNLDVRRLAARFNAVVVPFGSIGSADNARELRRMDGSSHTKPKSLALGG